MFALNSFKKFFNPNWFKKNSNQKAVNKSKVVETVILPKTKLLFGKYISICIDENSIQMAVAQHFGFRVRLVDVTKTYISKSLDTNDKINAFISSNIHDYLKVNCGIFSKVSLTISGQKIALRNFLMPALSKKELKTAIKFECKNQVPFPVEDCIHDYKICSKISIGKKNKYKISLIASTYSNILDQIKKFSFGGKDKNLWKIYHAQDSIGLLLKHLDGFAPEKNYTLLNIFKGHTEVTFFRGTQIQFIHSSEVTSAVQGGITDKTKFEFYSETIEDQLRTSFDYYSGQTLDSPSNEILVYGDLSYSDDLLEILEKNSSFKYIKFPINDLKSLYKKDNIFEDSLSASLAVVASVICNAQTIDLLPKVIAEKRREFIQTAYAKFVLGAMIVLLSFAWFAMDRKLQVAENQLEDTLFSIERFKNSEAYHTYNNLKKQILSSQSYLKKIKKEPSYLSHNLKELSNLTPKQIKLIHFDYRPSELDKNILIQGVVTSSTIPPEIILAEYTETLASSPLFTNINIIKHVKKSEKNKFFIEFVINLRGTV